MAVKNILCRCLLSSQEQHSAQSKTVREGERVSEDHGGYRIQKGFVSETVEYKDFAIEQRSSKRWQLEGKVLCCREVDCEMVMSEC